MPAMRRLGRYALTLCSGLSLALCVAVCVLWVRSYWVADRLDYVAPGKWFWGYSIRGTLAMMPSTANATGSGFIYDRADNIDSTHGSIWRAARGRWWEDLGFHARYIRWGPQWRLYLYFPHWSLALLTALLPATMILVDVRRKSRSSEGVCGNCGYDLRASPDRCPECGTSASGVANVIQPAATEDPP